MKNGAEDVKRHRWFKGTNWDDVLEKRLKPPIVPKVAHEGDTGNFDDYPEKDGSSKKRPMSVASISEKDVETFDDFWAMDSCPVKEPGAPTKIVLEVSWKS